MILELINSGLFKKEVSMENKGKGLAEAIGLNLLFPGVGYIYMGKWIVGSISLAFVGLITFATAFNGYILTWFFVNIIMTIDMIIIDRKNKVAIKKESMKECPACAELIQKNAKVCRFCNRNL